jgi:DNA polymerase-1
MSAVVSEPHVAIDWSTEFAMTTGPICHDDNLDRRGRPVTGCRGYGSTESGIVFLGIAPGRDEVRTGRPFTGPSGELLTAVLEALEMDRNKVYCTNMICWWKDDPNREEAARCRPRLIRELKEVRPKVIFLMGGIVTEIMTGRTLSKARGAVIWSEEFQCYMIPTYHPAAILRGLNTRGAGRDNQGAGFIYDLVRDLKKAEEVTQWNPRAPHARVEYEVVSSREDGQRVLDELPRGDHTPVAIDVETASPSLDEIDVFKDRLLCFAIATRDRAWVFPEEFARDLQWPEGVHWTMQNALFDVQVLRRSLGVWLDVREDTMLMSYTLDERPGRHGLKPLAREYLGAGWWEEDREKGKKKMEELPKPVLYKYNATDAVYTARLVDIFKPRQVADGVRQVYEDILIGSINVFKEIQLYGAKVNQDLLMKFANEWGGQYIKEEESLIALAQEAGWEGEINLSSSQQMSKMLYQILSLPDPCGKCSRTKQRPSSDQKHLEALKGQHEFVDRLIDFRHLAHMYDVYILSLLSHIKGDGKVHPVVKFHGTVTGRLAYTKPPMQTIPRPYKFGDTFGQLRKLFIPSDDDHVMVEVDYGKAEIWMAQAYSGDEIMLADLHSGDYHTRVAIDVLKKPVEQVTGEDRRKMKLVTFGVMYGREERSLAEGIKTSVPQAAAYIRNFFKRYPKYTEYYKDVQRTAQDVGELVSATGRKRRFIFIGSDVRMLKQAVNFPIQSTTSDCTLSSLIELHEKLKPVCGHVLFTVHDSIIFEVHKDYIEESRQIIHDVMTAQRFPGLPRIPIEMKIGKSWGDAKETHDCAKVGCLL